MRISLPTPSTAEGTRPSGWHYDYRIETLQLVGAAPVYRPVSV